MREIRTSGSTRGQWGAGYNRYPLSYSTGQNDFPRASHAGSVPSPAPACLTRPNIYWSG